MRKKYILINATITFFSLVLFLLTSCLIVSNVNKANIENEIKNYLQIVENSFSINDLEGSAQIVSKANKNIRVTFIDRNGNIVYDTAKTSLEDNHLDRLELQNLGDVCYRYSKSLGLKMLYVASYVDGTYIRVSMPQSSVSGVVNALIGYGILILFVICAITVFLLEKTFKQIVKPIQYQVEKLSSLVGDSVVEPSTDVEKLTTRIDEIHNDVDKKIFTLKKQTEKLNYILNHMQQGLIIVNALHNVILVNQMALQIFHCKEGDVLSKSYVYILRDIRLQDLVEEAILQNGEASARLEIEDKMFLFRISSLVSTFASYNGNNGVAIFIMDVTKEERLERMKLDFFANASHELKSPLTAVIGYQQMIEQGIITDETEIKDATKKTIREAYRMNQIIIEMLELSKLEMNPVRKKEVLSLNQILNSIVKSYALILEQKNLKLQRSGEDFTVEMNRDDLDRLLRNLIDNAIKYNKKEGYIYISLDAKKRSICIKDNGIGIALEHQSRVFERFYRVDKAKSKQLGGTGLGLAIVKHICINYNIHITLDSEENKGTQFLLEWTQL